MICTPSAYHTLRIPVILKIEIAFIFSWCLTPHRLHLRVARFFQTYRIVWSGVRCCVTSLYYGWGGWTCGTRSHLTCPGSPHRPVWGDLRLPVPPTPPVSGTGSSYPPPLPASASWRGTACFRVPGEKWCMIHDDLTAANTEDWKM